MIDVLVVGGGPAGMATALHATRAGLHTIVLEPREAPIDKACGEGLMPAAVRALQRMDVTVDGMPIRGIRYGAASVHADTDFSHGLGLGVRRTELHARLHDACLREGVEFRPTRVQDVEQDADGVRAGGLSARYLVGADGLHSLVRRHVDPQAHPGRRRRWGIRAHFAVAPWTDRVEVHWNGSSEAYVTPVAPDCVGVALLGSRGGSFEERLRSFVQLRGMLPAQPVARPMAAGPLRQDVSTRVRGRVLLVGDAAGYVDALTGEGLAIGFACAEAAVRRIVSSNAAAYEHDHRRITRRYRLVTEALLFAASRTPTRRLIVPTAARFPAVFGRVVSLLSG